MTGTPDPNDQFVRSALARAGLAVDDPLPLVVAFERLTARLEAMWAVPETRYQEPAQTFQAAPSFVDWR